MSTTYQITLKNCAFHARHGVFDAEAELGQRFFVDVTMEVVAEPAFDDDDIASTVHYGEAYEILRRVVTETRRNLIEVLARDIAQALCSWSPLIRRVDVALRKPGVPIAGILDHVEVRIEYRP